MRTCVTGLGNTSWLDKGREYPYPDMQYSGVP